MADAARPAGVATARSDHPSGDDRFKMLDATMKKHRFAPDALIEVLHTAQGLFGYLQPDLLYYIAHGLKLPPSRVYGVATFYHFFRFTPAGKHTCVVCTGTACYVKGAEPLLAAIEAQLKTVAGQTTADGEVSLTTALPGCLRAGPGRGLRRRSRRKSEAGIGRGTLERMGRRWISLICKRSPRRSAPHASPCESARARRRDASRPVR